MQARAAQAGCACGRLDLHHALSIHFVTNIDSRPRDRPRVRTFEPAARALWTRGAVVKGKCNAAARRVVGLTRCLAALPRCDGGITSLVIPLNVSVRVELNARRVGAVLETLLTLVINDNPNLKDLAINIANGGQRIEGCFDFGS